MSYVLQLSDGKFIVVDGGYDTKEDAASIYKILTENKPANHEQPIIAGWFITHLHIDHIGALRNFTNRYKDKVKVEGFYYNFPYVTISDIYPSNNGTWEDLMASCFPLLEVGIPRTVRSTLLRTCWNGSAPVMRPQW